MLYSRRDVFATMLAGVATHLSAAPAGKLGIPGPFPGRVVAVNGENSILSGAYQPEIIQKMMHKGMLELTGAPAWADAWRMFIQKGDVVGIKVCPVGGKKLCSDATVLRQIIDGINQAGVPNKDIVVYDRYRRQFLAAGFHKWLPEGVRWSWAADEYNTWQLGMDGYDPDVYMEMALVKPGDNPNDAHSRRSYASQFLTKQVNKIINLPVLKSHQSAGVTLTLKNMSHGFVNNVNRSHINRELNACDMFIPAVVDMPVIRQKVVLHIMDGVKAGFNGGPGTPPQFVWEYKTMFFGTDPVAMDRTGWKIIDAKRAKEGLPPVAETAPGDRFNNYWGQPEHIQLAGNLGLGIFDDKKIDLRNLKV
ncbi:MAG: DUF362 domain-containing protein [Bryobacterales bacterium]|nr:DUF362 domain-containing protein [Bryobacterales bacterium]